MEGPEESQPIAKRLRTQKKTNELVIGSSTRGPRTRMVTKKAATTEDLEAMPYIDHLVVNEEFLSSHNLASVCEVLQEQGWLHLFSDYYKINQDPCREFFNSYILTGTDDDLVASVKIGGRAMSFTYTELGSILNIPTQ